MNLTCTTMISFTYRWEQKVWSKRDQWDCSVLWHNTGNSEQLPRVFRTQGVENVFTETSTGQGALSAAHRIAKYLQLNCDTEFNSLYLSHPHPCNSLYYNIDPTSHFTSHSTNPYISTFFSIITSCKMITLKIQCLLIQQKSINISSQQIPTDENREKITLAWQFKQKNWEQKDKKQTNLIEDMNLPWSKNR